MTNTPPADLGEQGTALWDSIAGEDKYVLRPDELRTLEDACRITDMIDALTAAWVELGRPTMTVGSMGQDIIHPLVDKIDDKRMKVATLLAKLKLPDDPAAGTAVPNQQREAAQSRWGAAHGSAG